MASARAIAGLALSALGLALLIAALVGVFMNYEDLAMALFVVSLCVTALSWLITRPRGPTGPLIRAFTVSTELTCTSCGFKEIREFSKGDYILKPAGKCPRCGGERLITSIFREEGEKPTSEEESL